MLNPRNKLPVSPEPQHPAHFRKPSQTSPEWPRQREGPDPIEDDRQKEDPKEKNRLDSRIHLLRPDALLRTGPVDHADWNYKPILGWIQQQRFRLAISLLPQPYVPRLLEIGYGSGIFLPELARHCQELHGVDIHDRNLEIAGKLLKQNVAPQLHCAAAEALPFDTGYFDVAVAVSTLEFVGNLPEACLEIARVLKPEGSLILITPGYSFLADLALLLFTGESAKKDYGDRRQSLLKQVMQQFRVSKKVLFPPVAGRAVSLYQGYRLQPARSTVSLEAAG